MSISDAAGLPGRQPTGDSKPPTPTTGSGVHAASDGATIVRLEEVVRSQREALSDALAENNRLRLDKRLLEDIVSQRATALNDLREALAAANARAAAAEDRWRAEDAARAEADRLRGDMAALEARCRRLESLLACAEQASADWREAHDIERCQRERLEARLVPLALRLGELEQERLDAEDDAAIRRERA